jgi:hypothetical protein
MRKAGRCQANEVCHACQSNWHYDFAVATMNYDVKCVWKIMLSSHLCVPIVCPKIVTSFAELESHNFVHRACCKCAAATSKFDVFVEREEGGRVISRWRVMRMKGAQGMD